MKLFRYDNFINENEVFNDKMRVFYSDRFRELLTKISKGSKETPRIVAEHLLECEDSGETLDVYTLIDVTEKNDRISFVQVNRIARDTNLKDLRSFKVGSDYKFWSQGRVPEYSVGRWVRHLFLDVKKWSLTDSQLEEFVNSYKATFDSKDESDFKLVSGEEIRKWYLEDNYLEVKGQLGNSCMRYERCQKYLDIYVQNPEVCSLLVLFEGDKVKGRALVWELSDGSKYMDRIYTITDSDKVLFREWAEKNNMRTYDNTDEVGRVHLKVTNFGMYPYMDTFEFYDHQNGILSDTDLRSSKSDDIFQLKSTDGHYTSNEGRVWSEYESDWFDEDDLVWCEDVNSYVYYENAYWLDYQQRYVSHNTSVVYSEYTQQDYLRSDAVHNPIIDDWLYIDDGIIEYYIDRGVKNYIPKDYYDEYITIDGVTYSTRTYKKDPYTGEYHFLNDDIDGVKFKDYLKEKIETELGDVTKDYVSSTFIEYFNSHKEDSKNEFFMKLNSILCGMYSDFQMRRIIDSILIVDNTAIDKKRIFWYFIPGVVGVVSNLDNNWNNDSYREKFDWILSSMDIENIKKMGIKENTYLNRTFSFGLHKLEMIMAKNDLFNLLPDNIYKMYLCLDLKKNYKI